MMDGRIEIEVVFSFLVSDLLFQTSTSVTFAFAIYQRHMHAKDTKQAIRCVLNFRSLSVGSPCHLHFLTNYGTTALESTKHVLGNACDLCNDVVEGSGRDSTCMAVWAFATDNFPVVRYEDNTLRREKLLQSPASLKPLTFPKVEKHAFLPATTLKRPHVFEVRNAVRRLAIPSPHGVNRLRNLGAAVLVDAAGIDPDPIDWLLRVLRVAAYLTGEGAEAQDLLISLALLVALFENILVCYLIRGPSVRSYDVWRDPIAMEVSKLPGVEVEEAHCMSGRWSLRIQIRTSKASMYGWWRSERWHRDGIG
jgi:hypothetical protein